MHHRRKPSREASRFWRWMKRCFCYVSPYSSVNAESFPGGSHIHSFPRRCFGAHLLRQVLHIWWALCHLADGERKSQRSDVGMEGSVFREDLIAGQFKRSKCTWVSRPVMHTEKDFLSFQMSKIIIILKNSLNDRGNSCFDPGTETR